MDKLGMDTMGLVPSYTKSGRAYSHDERVKIAKRLGLCLTCFSVKTHTKSLLNRKAITDENVHQGTCIRCHPNDVPQHVKEAWEIKNRPAPIARVYPKPPQQQHHHPGTGTATTTATTSAAPSASSSAINLPSQGSSTVSRPSVPSQNSSQSLPSVTHPPQLQSSASDAYAVSTFQSSGAGGQTTIASSSSTSPQQRGNGGGGGGGVPPPPPTTLSSSASIGGRRSPSGAPVAGGGGEGSMNRVGSTKSVGSGNNGPSAAGSSRSLSSSMNSGDSSAQFTTTAPSAGRPSPGKSASDVHLTASSAVASNAAAASSNNNNYGGGSEDFTPSSNVASVSRPSANVPGGQRPGAQSCTGPLPMKGRNPQSGRTPNSSRLRKTPSGSKNRGNQKLPPSRNIDSAPSQPQENDANSAPPPPPPPAPAVNAQDEFMGIPELNAEQWNVLDQLESASRDESRLRQVLHTIRNHSAAMNNHGDGGGVVYKLKDVMDPYRHDSRFMVAAAGAFWGLCANQDDAKQEMIDAGAVDALVQQLRKNALAPPSAASGTSPPGASNNRDVVLFSEWAMGAVATVANTPESKAYVVQVAMEAVLETLEKQREWPGVLEWACRCLHKLVHTTDEPGLLKSDSSSDASSGGGGAALSVINKNIASIEEANGIPIIVEAMKMHTSESVAQLWAMRLLWRLLGRSSASDIRASLTQSTSTSASAVMSAGAVSSKRGLKQMLDAQFVAFAIKVTRAPGTPRELFQLTCELICAVLIGAAATTTTTTDDNSPFGKASDCVPSVVRLMGESADDVAISESGCRLLSTLCSSDVYSARELFQDAHAPQAIVHALEKHPDQLEIVRTAGWALWKMSSADSAAGMFDAELVKRAIKALLVAIEHFANSQDNNLVDGNNDLLLPFCAFVGNTCGVPGVADADVGIAVPVLCRALESPVPSSAGESGSPGTEVPGEAARALANLCAAFPDSVNAITRSLPVQRMVGLLREAAQNYAVRIVQLCSLLLCFAANSDADTKESLLSNGIMHVASAVLKDSVEDDSEDGFRIWMVVLDLILLLSSDRSPGKHGMESEVPGDIVPTIAALLSKNSNANPDNGKWISFSEKACSVLHNVLLGSSSSGLDLQEVVECMQVVIQSSNSDAVRDEACRVLWVLTCRYPDQNAQVLSKLFETIMELFVRYNSDEMPYRHDAHMLAAGALCSASRCIRGTPILVDSEDVDHVISAMYKVMECDEQGGVDTMSLLLAGILNLCYVFEDTMVESGVIVVVIDTMMENENNDIIQEKGCAVLAMLASSENLQVILSIVQTDGIDMLISALAVFPDNESIQTAACKAFSHLSIDHESRMLISSQGGLHLLVNAMNNHQKCLPLLETACSALLNITSDADEALIRGPELVNAIIDAMERFRDSSMLQENGMGVIQNISMKSSSAKQTIANAGGVDSVLACVVEFMGTPQVLERAFTTLWSLAVLEENQTRIAEADGIRLVLNGMLASMEYERVQTQGCGCLCTLASNSRNNTLIRDTGGVDAIVFSMWSHYGSETLQTEACRAFSSLAVNVQTNEVMVATEVEIEAIVSGMRRFPNCGDLQEHGCVALRNLLLSVDNVATVREAEAKVRSVVTQAASRFPDTCSQRADQILDSLE